ncbi:hypothetical protein [Klebsiella pneumoniae]|uniref:hypothetical protein n=1 Tax=Klebsiella pneumoniae TaxID=573 RepID=UPI0029E7CF63|nr:hypothetical protein [Klebsiella pneumoniae]
MFIRKPLSVLCGMLLGVSLTAAADVNGDMNNFFNKLGFASNTSQPQVWQGQLRLRLRRFAVCQNAGENDPAGQHDAP